MLRKNPTASIRTGFLFQDYWLAKCCADWLIHPEKWLSIRQESYPVEIKEGKNFHFDDLIIEDENEKYLLFQFKAKINLDQYWVWKDFLGTNKDSQTSLFHKWSEKSILRSELSDKIIRAEFVTNGIASPEIANFINGDKLDFHRIQCENPNLFKQICKEVGGMEAGFSFFSKFHLQFGQKSNDELLAELEDIFFRTLKVTEAGLNSLLLRIHREGAKQSPVTLKIPIIRSWCEWDDPKPLNQNFLIPSDFQVFDEVQHSKLTKTLLNSSGGVQVMIGKPGVGKSTYLAHLAIVLKKKNTLIIKHHYHISPDDPDWAARLENYRLVEALKAQFKSYPEILDDLANKNSANIEIGEYLDKLAQFHFDNNRSFILILDGLDHAKKYGRVEQLREILKLLIRPRPGLWVILGMQPIIKEQLPQIVFDSCPETQWIEIKGLSKKAMRQIFEKNILKLRLPPKEHNFRDYFFDELHIRTQGSPLYLRYVLQWLKNRFGNKQCSTADLKILPVYGDDICRYYEALWGELPSIARSTLVAIRLLQCPPTISHLRGFLNTLTDSPEDTHLALTSILHLLDKSPFGYGLFFFHDSFARFVLGTHEFNNQQQKTADRLLQWVRSSNDQNLIWREEKCLASLAGDDGPLLGLDRSWLLKSVRDCQDARSILTQLDAAGNIAFKKRDFSKSHEIGTWWSYFSNSYNFRDDNFERIWSLTFKDVDLNALPTRPDFHKMTPKEMYFFAQKTYPEVGEYLIEFLIIILNDRIKDNKYRNNGLGSSGAELPKWIVKIFAISRKHNPERIYHYITSIRNDTNTGLLFTEYLDVLYQTRQNNKVAILLNQPFLKYEQACILTFIAQTSWLESHTQIRERFLNICERTPVYGILLSMLLTRNLNSELPMLADFDLLPEKLEDYDIEKIHETSELFLSIFITAIIHYINSKDDEILNWQNGAPKNWSTATVNILIEVAKNISLCLKKGARIHYDLFFEPLRKIEPLDFFDDRDRRGLSNALKKALPEMFKWLIIANRLSGQEFRLKGSELACFTGQHFWIEDYHTLDFLAKLYIPLLTTESYTVIINKQKAAMPEWLVTFDKRTERYINLTEIARKHEQKDDYDFFLEASINNLLAYGFHKDLYLSGVLDAVKNCWEIGSNKVNDWLKRLTPIVDKIEKYTDGDDTSWFRDELADLLGKNEYTVLFRYYLHALREEDYIHAGMLWEKILENLDFSTQSQILLSSTALEPYAYRILTQKATTNDGAKAALNRIIAQLGERKLDTDELKAINSTTSPTEKPDFDFEAVLPSELSIILSEKTRWEGQNFAFSWFRHWKSKTDINQIDLFNSVQVFIETEGWTELSSEFLDDFYPMAYEYDLNVAFQCLTWSFANGNGWSKFFSKESSRYWNILKRDFSDRVIDFLEKSTFQTGKNYGKGGSFFVSLPRTVEFFNFFGYSTYVEQITECSINCAEQLMADLQLPNFEWIKSDTTDEIDLLFARQFSPSHLVRERATTALAELVKTDSVIYERLLNILRVNTLDSLLTLRLLILIKATQTPISHINISDVHKALPFTNIVLEKTLDELLYLNTGMKMQLKPKRRSLAEPLFNFPVPRNFEKYSQGFIPPVYFEALKGIGNESGLPIMNIWAFYVHNNSKESGFIPDQVIQGSLQGSPHDAENMLGASSMGSEVFKSAYLQTLEYLWTIQKITDFEYNYHSLRSFPVNLSLWKIQSKPRPEWWFHPKKLTDNILESITPKQLSSEVIQEMLLPKADWQILAMDGFIWGKVNSEGVEGLLLHVIPFGYRRVFFDTQPTPEQIADLFDHKNWVCADINACPFLMFEDSVVNSTGWEEPLLLGGWQVIPLVANHRSWPINMFQWYRAYSSPFTLFPHLQGGQPAFVFEDGVHFGFPTNCFARWQDWVGGIKEKNCPEIGQPYGQWLEIHPDYLQSYLSTFDFKIGFLIKQSFIQKTQFEQGAKIESSTSFWLP